MSDVSSGWKAVASRRLSRAATGVPSGRRARISTAEPTSEGRSPRTPLSRGNERIDRIIGEFEQRSSIIVDGISMNGGLTYTENFEGALNPNVTLANTAPATPFGLWARLFPHITDNDKCAENTTCAWLFTDPLRTAFFPDMAFGPGSAVIHNLHFRVDLCSACTRWCGGIEKVY